MRLKFGNEPETAIVLPRRSLWQRPWLLFGYFVGLILLAITCVFCNALWRVWRQHSLFDKISAVGGAAGYDYPYYQIPLFQSQDTGAFFDSNTVDLDQGLALTKELANLKSLTIVERKLPLTANQVAAIASLQSLQELNIKESVVSDTDVRELARLPNLRRLQLYNTDITTSSLTEFSKLRNLQRLAISGTRMQYEEVVLWAQAHPQCQVYWQPRRTEEQLDIARKLNAKRYDVRRAEPDEPIQPHWRFAVTLDDAHPLCQEIFELDHIDTLTVCGPQFMDHSKARIASLPHLRKLTIKSASITPTTIDELARLPELQELEVIGVDIDPREFLRLRLYHPRIKLRLNCRTGAQHPVESSHDPRISSPQPVQLPTGPMSGTLYEFLQPIDY